MNQPDDKQATPGEAAAPQVYREGKPRTGPVLQFDLAQEIAAVRAEAAERNIAHSAVTLVKHSGLRVVLVVMNAGAVLQKHQTSASITLQGVEGRVRVGHGGAHSELAAGGLLAFDRNVEHEVEALEPSAFVLSLSHPEAPDDAHGLQSDGTQATMATPTTGGADSG